MTTPPLLHLEEVSFGYGSTPVLEEVTIPIERGTILGIIGPNGAGKTTLVKLLLGVVRPTAGRITLEGRPLETVSRAALARRLAFVPQSSSVAFPFLVEELVAMGRTPHMGLRRWPSTRDKQVVEEAIDALHLEAVRSRPFQEISGGEQQRTLLARALAQEPEVLLLDEPVASLDVAHGLDLLETIVRLNRDRDTTVVMVLHDLALARLYSKEVAMLHAGRLHASGPPDQVMTKDEVHHVYGVALEELINAKGERLLVPRRREPTPSEHR